MEAGEEGEGGDARRLCDHPHRDHVEPAGESESGGGTLVDELAEQPRPLLVERHHRLAHHERDGEPEILPDRPMAERGPGVEPHPAPCGPPPLEGEVSDDGTSESPPEEGLRRRIPRHPPGEAAEDDPEVVDEGGECRDEEPPPGVLGRHEQRAEPEEHLGGERDPGEPGEPHGRLHLREDELGEPSGEEDGHHRQRHERGADETEHRGERLPGPGLVALRLVPGEDRHEGDREVPAGEQEEEVVGDDERLEVEVGLGPPAQQARHDHVPEEAEQSGQEDPGGDDQRRPSEAGRRGHDRTGGVRAAASSSSTVGGTGIPTFPVPSSTSSL